MPACVQIKDTPISAGLCCTHRAPTGQGNLSGPTGAGAGLAPRLLLSVSPGCVRSALPSTQGATIGTCSINSCASL